MNLTADDLIVRPYAPADKPRLIELLRQVWPHKHDIGAHVANRWWWQWAETPLFVVEEPAAARLVGLCAHMPFTLRTSRQELPGAWFVDFFVLPAFQGLGLGVRLTRAVQERYALTASLSQTAMAYRVFHKLGWSERMPVTLFMRPLALPWPSGGGPRDLTISTSAVDPGLSDAEELDALWAGVQDAYPAIAVRSGAAIRQRYASHGGRAYQMARVYRGSVCTGYMVARVVTPMSGARPTQGLIVDHLVAPGDAASFKALLTGATNWLAEQGARRIFCIATPLTLQRVLRSRGFVSPSTPLLGRFVSGNTKWLTYATTPASVIVEGLDWYLTLGDCDVDAAWFQE